MNILIVIHAITGGGAERVAVNLANRFVEEGHVVSLSCDMEIPRAYQVNTNVSMYDHRRKCETTRFWSRYKLYRFIKMEWNLRMIAKKSRPDCVISFMTEMNIYVIMALLGTGTPIVATEHTNVARMSGRFNKATYKYAYKLTAACTVLTRYDYKKWKKLFKNVVYMPNPCNIEEDSAVYYNRKRKKVVLAAGRVDAWSVKGFDNLIRAWNKICKNHPGWSLEIAGKGNEKDEDYLKSLATEEALSSIHFLGFRKDICELMASSEIFVLTSRWEGLPMSLLEAMNVGCCCVAFDVETGPSDIIKDGINGILVDNQNVDDLAEKLSMVMSNETFRHNLANKAHEGILKFGIDNISIRWHILFSKIIKKNKYDKS